MNISSITWLNKPCAEFDCTGYYCMQISPLMFLPKMAEIANLCLLLISWDYGDPEPDYKCYLLSVLGSFAIIFRIDRAVGSPSICGTEYYDISMCFNRKEWL